MPEAKVRTFRRQLWRRCNGLHWDQGENVPGYHRGAEWLNWSILETPANAPSGGKTISAATPTASPIVSPSTGASSMPRNKRKPAAISICTGSTKETADEISGCQTLDRDSGSQNQRQSGRCVLEVPEGNRRQPRTHAVRSGGFDRYRAPRRQSVVGDTAV